MLMLRISEDSRLVDQRITEQIVRLRSLEEIQKREQKRLHLPVVTLSRQIGTHGTEVAQHLVELLGSPWQIWDQQLIDAIATHADARKELVQSLDEHAQGEIETVVKSLLGVQVLEPHSYHRHLVEVLLTIERAGYAIILGRGANFALPRALRVRLRATMPVRIQRVMQQMNLSREQAERKIHQTDEERAAFVQRVFHRRIDEEDAYDLIILTDKLTPQEVARIIYAAVQVRYPDWQRLLTTHALVNRR